MTSEKLIWYINYLNVKSYAVILKLDPTYALALTTEELNWKNFNLRRCFESYDKSLKINSNDGPTLVQ